MKHFTLSHMLVVSCVFMAWMTTPISAQDSEKLVKNLILPGESFRIQNRSAFILWPEKAQRKSPQPWVMYGPTLPAYPDRHEKWMHQQFLDAGNKAGKNSQPSPASAIVYKDLEYARAGKKGLLLDLYYPKTAEGPVPVVVWVHGGGWKNGSKDRCPASWLVEHG
jgi:acetyl esterase/lipase